MEAWPPHPDAHFLQHPEGVSRDVNSPIAARWRRGACCCALAPYSSLCLAWPPRRQDSWTRSVNGSPESPQPCVRGEGAGLRPPLSADMQQTPIAAWADGGDGQVVPLPGSPELLNFPFISHLVITSSSTHWLPRKMTMYYKIRKSLKPVRYLTSAISLNLLYLK